MIRAYSLSELADVLGGELKGTLKGKSAHIQGISIDTRTLKPGDLFVAIKGPNFDGHGYLDKAIEAGAAGVVIASDSAEQDMPRIVVDDTFKALGRLGSFNREGFAGPLVAITGSCGKTSVKEMLAAIMAEEGKALATEGNLNNGFGVPLTLFRLGQQFSHAAVELGISAPGEMQYISEMTQPDVSVITNAAETHLKDLVDVAGVAHEKGFILDALSDQGTAILNLDDAFFSPWKERVQSRSERRVLSFSLENSQADAFASDVVSTDQGMSFNLHLRTEEGVQKRSLCIAFWGRHQVQNACCAALAAMAVNIGLDNIVQGLENARPYQRRGQRYRLSDQTLVIDETYNANPKATLAAVDQLADCQGKTILVLGDMLDLGAISDARHREVGEYARLKGVDYLGAFGQASAQAVESFGAQGCHFDDKEALAGWIRERLDHLHKADTDQAVTVLVKGSRGMEMLDIVRSLVGSRYKGER